MCLSGTLRFIFMVFRSAVRGEHFCQVQIKFVPFKFQQNKSESFLRDLCNVEGMGTYLLNPWVTAALSSLMKRFVPRTPYSEFPNSFIRPLVMIPPDYFLCNHGHSEQTLELCGAILIPVVPCVLILKSISHKW